MKMSKKMFVLFGLCAGFILCAAVFLHGYRNSYRDIKLGNVVWKYEGRNQSSLMDGGGKVLMGPGVISLCVKFPYVHGSCFPRGCPEKIIHFFIHEPDGSVVTDFENPNAYFRLEKQTRASGVDWSRTMGFHNLRGQWGDKDLLESWEEAFAAGKK